MGGMALSGTMMLAFVLVDYDTNLWVPRLLMFLVGAIRVQFGIARGLRPVAVRAAGGAGLARSCQENLQKAMAALGYEGIEIPQPINLFMNIPVGLDATIGFEPAPTKAGDSATLRAELDIVVAVSACPQDMIPINSNNPTDIVLEVS